MINIKVLYEDNHVIAVVKPAGVLSQADKTGDVSMFDEVKTYIKEKYQKPGNAFLGLVHRLDRPVYGIMLFAKTSKGASRLSEQFRNHQIEKTYQAIVVGKPTQNKGVLINNLIKDERLHKARPAAADSYGVAKEAKLYYEVLKSNGKFSLLKIQIEGGKFHQIRSQLSLAGFPILGDVKYKAKESLLEGNIALCATGISFRQPTGEEIIKLEIEIPSEWQKYLSTGGA